MRSSCAAVFAVALIAGGCGAKRPVLYPNATYKELGEPTAQEIVDYCIDRAHAADIADTRPEGATKGAVGGAVVGSAIGGAIGWILGNPGKGAAAGAAHGGGHGAVRGAAKSGESDSTFQGYVNACLRERGLQPVGWK